MISAFRYRDENEKLMFEYEGKVREWLKEKGEKDICDCIPFIRDGVVCPEVWFDENNKFRPLFILKEVSLGIEKKKELPGRLMAFGNSRYIELVENPFEDVEVGKLNTWKRVAKLAKALEDIQCGNENINVDNYDVSYQPTGEEYIGEIEVYRERNNRIRTGNPLYRGIIDKIAVLDIKKIAAGKNVDSELSRATEHFTMHIEPFQDLISRQIKLINPTVIICCGIESRRWIGEFLGEIKESCNDIDWVNTYHPAAYGKYSKQYFDVAINRYKELKMKKNL